jgi:4-hydroxy-2-oxoheptanedioate aldolase
MFNNKLKEKLSKGLNVFGPFCKIHDPAAIEIAALAGFDFVIIDMEHGTSSIESAQNMIRAAEARGITPVIRVTENNESSIMRCLDIGVHAIQVPQVCIENDAAKVVNAVKFFPEGQRGVCKYVRAADYSSLGKSAYFESANNEVLTIVQIEGIQGIENLEKIIKIEGIDVIFLGPYDLSQSCGVPGQVHHEKVQNLMVHAVKIARAKGIWVGTFVENEADALKWCKLGVQYISFSVDVGILQNAYTTICANLKKQNTFKVLA